MNFMRALFGLIGGAAIGVTITGEALGGGLAGAVIGLIISWFIGKIGGRAGEAIVEAEASAISGPKRNAAKAIFWWLALFILAAVALVRTGISLN